MSPIQVQLEIRPWLRAMNALGKDQIPYAVARTLTDLAKEGQAEVRRVMPQRFTLRSKHALRGIHVEAASKRDWPRAAARVGTRDEYIARHEAGGVFRPHKKQHHAIPTHRVKRTKRDKIRKRDMPRAIMSERGGFITDRTIRLKGRKRGTSRAMFLLRRTIRLKPRLGFEATVRQAVAGKVQPTFNRNMAAALRSRAPR